MSYFSKVKVGDKVYSLVYGVGEVCKTHENSFYVLEVSFDGFNSVPYTEDGVPAWSDVDGNVTLFYLKDMKAVDMKFKPINTLLTIKEIKMYLDNGLMEMRCPSGLWQDVRLCPKDEVQKALNLQSYYLFRRK